MPTKDSMIKTARITSETWAKMQEYMEKEDVTFSGAIKKLVEEADMPKQRKEYVNTEKFIEACERTNRDPQSLIDTLTKNLLRG